MMEAPRSAMRDDARFLLSMLIVGLLLRLDLILAAGAVIDADEAIVGLMASHIAAGAPPPVFYYGQHYMGSLEAILAALSFSVFGQSALALKAVPLIFSLALIPLVYRLAELCASRDAARWSAALVAVAPSALLIWSGKARGGFVETIVLGVWALIVAVRWYQAYRPRLLDAAIGGCVLGIGWWVNNQIIYFMVPLPLLLLMRLRREGMAERGTPLVFLVRHTAAALAGFLVGSLPYWVYNLRLGFPSAGMFQVADGRSIAEHLAGVAQFSLPIIVGARRDWSGEESFPGSVVLAALVYGTLLVAFLVSRAEPLLALLRGRLNRRAPLELLVALLLLALIIFCISPFGALYQAPRYLLPVYPALFVLVGATLAILQASVPRGTLFLGTALFALAIGSSFGHERSIPGEPFVYGGERVTRDHRALIEWLDARHISLVRTNYWIGYKLAFETNERVRFLVFQEPHQVRIPAYEELAPADRLYVPLILVPSQAPIVERGLRVAGARFQRAEVSGYVVLYAIELAQGAGTEVPNESFVPLASHGAGSIENLRDRDLATRWGSGSPQSPGMTVTIDLKRPMVGRQVIINYGQWWHDYGRGLTIVARDVDGVIRNVATGEDVEALRYVIDRGRQLQFRLPEAPIDQIVLSLSGSHPTFDWSIAELRLVQ